jgi:amidase
VARTVWDAAHILNIIASQDPADNYTLANPNPGIDYTAGLNQTPQAILATARIGIPANVMATLMLPEFNTLNSVTPVASSYYAAAALMASNGAFINQNSTYSAWLQFLNQTDNTQNVAVADFRANLNDYLSALTGPAPRSLEQVRNFTQSYPPEGYPAHSTSTFDLALSQPPNTDASIWAQYQQNLYFANEGGVVGALDRDNLDAVILPSVVAPFVADLGGLPVVSVPLGFYPANQTIYNVLNLTKAAPGIPYVLFMLLCSLSSFPPLSLFVCRCISYELVRTLTSVLQLRHQLPRSEMEREEID